MMRFLETLCLNRSAVKIVRINANNTSINGHFNGRIDTLTLAFYASLLTLKRTSFLFIFLDVQVWPYAAHQVETADWHTARSGL
jgi:hypothetical protein